MGNWAWVAERARGGACLGVAILTACGGRVDCEALGEPALELGEGERSFSAIAEGHRFGREYGGQGGSHIWVALRASGIWPGHLDLLRDDEAPLVDVRLTGTSGGALFGPPQRVFLGAREPYEVAGLQIRLSPENDDTPSGSTESRLWAQVTDVCGTEVETELTVEVP